MDIKQFTKDNLVSGYQNGTFTEAQVNIYCVNYMLKGVFDEADIVEVAELMNPTEEEI